VTARIKSVGRSALIYEHQNENDMINLSTPSDQLLAEIETDMQKVMWWLNKEKGNTTRSNKRKELARKYRARWAEEKKRFIGDTLEYKSALGNRWFCYDVVQKPAGAYDIMVGVDKFIYWETLGSIGAFLPQWWTDAETMTAHPSCLIYTSHFFQRFCERAKIQFRSREMVMSFVSELNYKPYKEDTDKDGNPILVFRMNHTGFAYAVRRKDNPLVIEVRTYLDETNMSPSKLKRYEELAQRIEADGFEDDTAWLGFIHAAQAGESLGL
jgi:hypothetical protein